MTDQVTDHGLIGAAVAGIKENAGETVAEADADKGYNETGDMAACLQNGIIPEEYKGIIESAEVKEKKVFVKEESWDDAINLYGSEEEMKERAREGYFARDPERNLVYCPAGEILGQKSIKKNGNIRYANKTACRHCKNRNKCYKGKNEWKEIDFNKDTLEKPYRDWLEAEGGRGDCADVPGI